MRTQAVDVVVVDHLDRATRSPRDVETLIDLVESTMVLLESAHWVKALPRQAHEKSSRYAINSEFRARNSGRRKEVSKIKQARIEAVRDITRKAIGREPQERYARGFRESA
jgi:reverse gyrase